MNILAFLLILTSPAQQIPVDPIFGVCVVNELTSPTVLAGSGEMCMYNPNSVIAYPYGDGSGYLRIPAGSYIYGYSRSEVRLPFDNFPPSNSPPVLTYFINENIPIVFDMIFRNNYE